MKFSIEAYDHKHLEGMSALYNGETAFESHIAPLTPERFIELVEKKSYFDPEGLLVAVAGGRVAGWVHACVAPGSEPGHDPGNKVARIRMLIYPAGRLKVGKALVEQATAWLKISGPKKLLAMHAQAGYPFYRGLWVGGEPMCPATLAHVQLAFEVGGYKNTQESVFMVAPIEPQQTAAAAPIEFDERPAEMKHEPMRESWIGFEPQRIRAMIGGEEAGGIGWVMLPHLADRLGAPAMNIWSLGVKENHRRKGVAAALIARSMELAHARGARFASVGTQLWNAPAHASYAKLGYVPHCVVVGRTLEIDGGKKESSS